MEAQELLNAYISKLTPETYAAAQKDPGNWGSEDYEDYRVVKGVQQALIDNKLSGQQLDQLILQGAFTPKQTFLLGDIHDFGARTPGIYDDPRFKQIVAQNREQGEIRRKELGL